MRYHACLCNFNSYKKLFCKCISTNDKILSIFLHEGLAIRFSEITGEIGFSKIGFGKLRWNQVRLDTSMYVSDQLRRTITSVEDTARVVVHSLWWRFKHLTTYHYVPHHCRHSSSGAKLGGGGGRGRTAPGAGLRRRQ